MDNKEAINWLTRIRDRLMTTISKQFEAMTIAIAALEKQEQERWRLYPAEKPKGGEIVFVTMPAYTDRNGEEQLFGGVICAYHIDNYRGGRWGRSDGVTYGALGLCDVDPVAWRPIPKPYTEEEA